MSDPFERVVHHGNLLKIEKEKYYGVHIQIYINISLLEAIFSHKVYCCILGTSKFNGWIERCPKYSNTLYELKLLLTG